MIKFRQKDFTLQEGHYTGPKDMEKVPSAAEVIGKGTVGGAVIGGVIGKYVDDKAIKGALTGGKWGFLGSVLLKMFINYLHNPMTSVKYREVDKNIRRQFGIYRATGITIGDSIDKRASVDEKFGFNDRNITSYKINFAVSDNQVTMYTLGLDNAELEKVNSVLDYYCKKYYGMEYTSTILNQRLNSYSVSIVFTNYPAISSFIMELSEKLLTKINLLDNKAFVSSRLEEATKEEMEIEEEEKNFSTAEINKYDLIKILTSSYYHSMKKINLSSGWKKSLSNVIMQIVSESLLKISANELVRSGIPRPREEFGNTYLEETLKKLRYIEGFNYTIGDKKASDNISMAQGRFIVTVPSGSDSEKSIDKSWSSFKGKINKCVMEKVSIYTYTIESRKDFEFILKKLMQTRIIFNIFE